MSFSQSCEADLSKEIMESDSLLSAQIIYFLDCVKTDQKNGLKTYDLARELQQKEKFNEAKRLFLISFQDFKADQNWKMLSSSCTGLEVCFREMNNYLEAYRYSYQNYIIIKKFNLSGEYLQIEQMLNMSIKLGDQELIDNNLALLESKSPPENYISKLNCYHHFIKKDYKACFDCFQKVKLTVLDNPSKLGNVYTNLSSYYSGLDDWDSTLYYLNFAEKIFQENELFDSGYTAWRLLTYRVRGDDEISNHYTDSLLMNLSTYDLKSFEPVYYNHKYHYYLEKKNTDSSLVYLRQIYDYDKIAKRETDKELISEIHEFETDFDVFLEGQILKNQKLEKEKELSAARAKLRLISVVVSLLVIILSLVIFFIRRLQKKNRTLAAQMRMSVRESKMMIGPDPKINEATPSTEKLTQLDDTKLMLDFDSLIVKEKLFLEPDLSMVNIANKLDTNVTYLSQMVNNQKGQNFRSFINQLRIKYVCTQFEDQDLMQRFSIDGIGEKAGFKSRTSFYRSFKEFTGLTPTQYLKQLKGAL